MGEHYLAEEQIGNSQTKFDRMYQDLIAPSSWVGMRHAHMWRPPMDVYETDDAIVVRIEVAGMSESDFHVELQARTLLISGARQDPSPKMAYHQMEIHYGEFQVQIYLHWPVVSDSIEAVYADGFLQVRLPRSQARKLQVVK